MHKDLGIGNLKQVLVSATNVACGAQLGTYHVQRYSSIGGMLQVVGSLTMQIRFGISSASFQVTSSFVANSGAMAFSMSNPGLYVNVQALAASSQNATVLVFGAP